MEWNVVGRIIYVYIYVRTKIVSEYRKSLFYIYRLIALHSSVIIVLAQHPCECGWFKKQD